VERKSSIHIEKGELGEFFHNDRTKPTANSIFSTKNNSCNLDGLSAIDLYKKDIKEKTKKYVERTGRSLHKNTITLLSAIVNLDKQHTQEDLEKICKYLEESLGTKIYQYAVHRDEGWIDEETGEKHINYHAHILFSGLDNEGRSVRKKLTRSYLIKLQDEVAKILKMKRGINYTKERKKRPKRLNTYEYKEHAKRKSKELKEKLAKIKDLKEENKRLRELLKELGAERQDYAYLEQFIKNLKKLIKDKLLTEKQLKEKIKELEEELKRIIKEKKKKIEELEEENKKLREKAKELNDLEFYKKKVNIYKVTLFCDTKSLFLIENFLKELKQKNDILDYKKINEKTTIIQTAYSEIVDTQDKIELKTALIKNEYKNYNESILQNEVKIMIDLALYKGWKLEKIKASGSKEFIEAVNKEIQKRLKKVGSYDNYDNSFKHKL
jgi:hypothetical protein